VAANPRMVITTVDVPWDGGIIHTRAGTVVDIPAGHPLETAYGGTSNLLQLDAPSQQAVSAGSGPG